MKTPDGLLTQNAYAQKKGITHRAVQKAIASGKLSAAIVKHGNKDLLNEAKADQLWAQQQTVHPHAATSKILAKPAKDLPASPANLNQQPTAIDPPDSNAYQKSRSIREGYLARLAKIEYEEKIRKVVPADEVKQASFTTARRLRDTLLTMPDRLATVFAHEKDEFVIHQILRDELERALENMADIVKSLNLPEA